MSRGWMPLDTGSLAMRYMMSPEEFGAYVRVILWLWNSEGRFRFEERSLANVSGVSLRKWRSLSLKLMRYARDGESLEEFFYGGLDQATAKIREAISSDVRAEVFNRDGEKCTYCGADDGPFHLDHVLPVVRGGRSISKNLVVACARCNTSKGAKTLSEWPGPH